MDHDTHPQNQRSAGIMAFEMFGIGLATSLIGLLLWRCFDGVQTARQLEDDTAANSLLIVLVGALFSGYLLADFGSGVVHFTFDRFWTSDTPVLGKNFVLPFRQHHSDPKHITRHDFLETNGNNCLATCPALIAFAIIPFDYTIGWHTFTVATLVFAAIGTFATNQFHKWAHAKSPPPVVAWLQEKHLILPRDHHQIHHTHPYNIHYCITTGWLNSILMKVNFWRFLELFFQHVLRLKMYTEETKWEQLTGSPAYIEREQMAALGADAE